MIIMIVINNDRMRLSRMIQMMFLILGFSFSIFSLFVMFRLSFTLGSLLYRDDLKISPFERHFVLYFYLVNKVLYCIIVL